MLKKLLVPLLCAGLFTTGIVHAKDVKLLVLIIASDHFPVYVELQKSWKRFMHYDPEHVESYFIRANPDLPMITAIEGDIIWSRATEGWPPLSSGIIDKTILSLEAMLPRLHEFDYVLRTNLSSFYVFPRLLAVLKDAPRQNFYFGSNIGGDSYVGSGCGFIMSTDIARKLVKHKNEFLGNCGHDDVLVGEFLHKHRINLKLHARLDFCSMEDWNKAYGQISSDDFHFRVKNEPSVRLQHDIYMHAELLKKFYPHLVY